MVRATVRLGSKHPHCEGDHPGQVVFALPLPAAAWKNALMHNSLFQCLQHTQDIPLFSHPRRSILVVPSPSFHPPSPLHHHHHMSHLIHNSRLHRRHGAHSCLDVRAIGALYDVKPAPTTPPGSTFPPVSTTPPPFTTLPSSTEQSPIKDPRCDGVAGALTLLFLPKLRTLTETDRVEQTNKFARRFLEGTMGLTLIMDMEARGEMCWRIG